MLNRLIRTDENAAALVIRLALAAVIFPHGAQKLFGWFGGPGLQAIVEGFARVHGLPAWITLLVVLVETLGSVLLAVGALGRVWAAGIGAVMAGAVALSHHRFGFFMNWWGRKQGEGFEFHILAFAMALAIVICGSGRWSMDRWLYRRRLLTAPTNGLKRAS